MSLDDIVRAIGSNPYLVSLGLIFTIGPVAFQLTKAFVSFSRRVSTVVRLGLKRQAIRQQMKAIRGRVKKDRYGFFTVYDLNIQAIYLFLVRATLLGSFFICSAFSIYVILYSLEIGTPMVGLATYAAFAGLAGMTWVQSELQDVIWRKEFVVRSLEKEVRFLEGIHDELAEERDRLVASGQMPTPDAEGMHL